MEFLCTFVILVLLKFTAKMQSSLRLRICICFLLTLPFASCERAGKTKAGSLFDYVPPEAGVVMHIETGRLREKIDWNAAHANIFYNMLLMEAKEPLLKYMVHHPDSSALDLGRDAVLFYGDNDKNNPGDVLCGLFWLQSESKMRKLIHAEGKNLQITKDKNYAWVSDGHFAMGWNKSVALVVEAQKTHAEQVLARVFGMPPDSSLTVTDKGFEAFRDNDDDINVWISSEDVNPEAQAQPLLDDELSLGLDFNKGNVTLNTMAYAMDDTSAHALRALFGKSGTGAFSMLLPDKTEAFVSLHVDPGMLQHFLSDVADIDLASILGDFMRAHGIQADAAAWLRALGGDMLIASPGFPAANDQEDLSPDYAMAFSVKSDSFLDAALQLAGDHLKVTPEGDKISQVQIRDMQAYVLQKDKLVFVTSSLPILAQVTDDKDNSGVRSDVISMIPKDPVVFYMDFQGIVSATTGIIPKKYDAALESFIQDVRITVFPPEEMHARAEVVFSIRDDSDYSINVIMRALNKMLSPFNGQ